MVEENIKKACNVIEEKINKRYLDEYFLRLYSFTNENLKGYMQFFKYEGKNVLTTGSSGDQALNLISYGCKDISVFDINPFVKYYFDLKRAAILTLSEEKYLDFFHGTKNKSNIFAQPTTVFNQELYNKMSRHLEDDSKKFWDELFKKYDLLQIKRNLFFLQEEKNKKNIILNNRYLDYDCYDKLRKQFDKVNISFYHDNLPKLKKINDEYDYIFLSNIFDYIFNLPLKTSDEYDEVMIGYRVILESVMNYLKENGTIFYHYVWDTSDNDYELLYLKYLKDFSDKIVFQSSDHLLNSKDCVYCTKNKKRVLNAMHEK